MDNEKLKSDDNGIDIGNKGISAEDVEFMRAAVEKADTTSDSNEKWSSSVIFLLGLLSMTGCISVHFCVRSYGNYKWIWPIFYSLCVIGACYSFVGMFLAFRDDRKTGFVQKQGKQLTWVWVLILINGPIWTLMGKYLNNFALCEPGFLFALLFFLCLCVTIIFYPESWITVSLGALIILVGMVLSHFIMAYQYMIYGLTIGSGLMISVVLDRILCREKN
ncbi:MAG: hypothetical protein ACYTEU_14340 [Planctomycetota bacterium]|jgi:hypothetical protein